MGILNFFPGGDSSLNAVAYANAASIPASADAGTVAIITSVALGTAYVSAIAPASPVTGDLWIITGSASLAPIALTDEITLYPLLAYQYDGSAWVLREGYVYSGSGWAPLSTHLYDYGAFILASDINVVASNSGGLSKNADHLAFTCNRGEGADAYCVGGFDTPINLTNISTIRAYINHAAHTSGAGVYLGISADKSATLAAFAYSTAEGLKTLSLDVSAFTGEYYVMLYVSNPQGEWYTTESMNVYEVYYEV